MSDMKSIERSVGEYPILWAFRYRHEAPVRVTDPDCSMDTVFSHMETLEGVFHVVAPNENVAKATFDLRRPNHVYTQIGNAEKMLVVNAIVSVGR